MLNGVSLRGSIECRPVASVLRRNRGLKGTFGVWFLQKVFDCPQDMAHVEGRRPVAQDIRTYLPRIGLNVL